MKAEGLQIGNYLYNDRVMVKIDGRSIFDIWSYPDSHKYQPIPINDMHLERLGFKNKGMYYWFIDDLDRRFDIYETEKTFALTIEKSYLTNIDYIHELQNIIYSLTGQMLKLK